MWDLEVEDVEQVGEEATPRSPSEDAVDEQGGGMTDDGVVAAPDCCPHRWQLGGDELRTQCARANREASMVMTTRRVLEPHIFRTRAAQGRPGLTVHQMAV